LEPVLSSQLEINPRGKSARRPAASATAHYWARELTKLGHEVRLMPAKDVKAYVKRNKNDAADAEAICEAVRRPTMRFVRVKSAEQQAS
jgi:transposase